MYYVYQDMSFRCAEKVVEWQAMLHMHVGWTNYDIQDAQSIIDRIYRHDRIMAPK